MATGRILFPCWEFPPADHIADVDTKNVEYAKRNIVSNNLKHRIRPLQTVADEPLIPLDKLGLEKYSPPIRLDKRH